MIALELSLPVLWPLLAGTGVYLLPFASEKRREGFALGSVVLESLLLGALILSPAQRENVFYPVPGAGAGAMVSQPVSVTLLHIAEGLPLTLSLDGLGRVFLALIAFLWPLATLYSLEYMEEEGHRPRFFAFYVAAYGITAGVALSGNLLTMYFFYELLTLVTVPLVAHEGDRRGMAAARKYILYSMGGAALSFVGIVMLTERTGLLPYRFGGYAPAGEERLLAAYLLTFAGFGVKAAVFPFHGWLPAAGVAPTPVTALLHAVAVVKSGVFACIRAAFYAFGPALLGGTRAQDAVLLLTSFTILFGSAMALREQHWKRRLAYSTVSNLSYILFGMGLLTGEGLAAGLSHMLFHGLMKITLFFCAGTVLCKTGREYVPYTEGLGRKMPWTFAVYSAASLALTGAPLLPGFISKLNLLQAAGASENPFAMAGVIALLLSALLTGAYLLPTCVRAYLPGKDFTGSFTERDRDPGWRMLLPFAVLTAAMLYFGLHASPLMGTLEALLAPGM